MEKVEKDIERKKKKEKERWDKEKAYKWEVGSQEENFRERMRRTQFGQKASYTSGETLTWVLNKTISAF